MTRTLRFAFLLLATMSAGSLSAQTPRMALPTLGPNQLRMATAQPTVNTAQPAVNTVQPVPSTAQPTKNMALPTGAPTAQAPAKPVLVAAQPTKTVSEKPVTATPPSPAAPGLNVFDLPPATATPAANPAATPTPPAKAEKAPSEPEWRIVQKPELPPASRFDRTTALQKPREANRIRDCLLKASAEVQLPAQEAGVLVELQAIEGLEVQQNQPLGRIDDIQPRLQRKAAMAERAVTAEKGKSTINERYALKASDVAKQEWQKAVESNDRAPNSVSQVEVMRLKLTYEKGLLEFERAQEERKVEGLTTAAKDVDVEAAEDAIRRRQLVAPIAGTIVELTPHVGEWLKPGDPVLKIVNMEILKIEGYVNIDHFRQDQLRNQVVDALVDMGNKQEVTVPAKITFVSPVVEPGGEYRIKAEIQNRKSPQTGEWVLKPGLTAELILNTK